jgi:hypothetical protein
METHEIDDDKARRIEELIVRLFDKNLFLSACYGPTQDPYIVTDGNTIKELLPFKHSLNALLKDGHNSRVYRHSARIRRWDAVWLAIHMMKDKRVYNNSTYANLLQDIIDWGWRNRHVEDNPNRPNLKPR